MFEQLLKQNPTARPKKYTVSQRMINGISVLEVSNPWDLSAMEYEVLRQLHAYKKQRMIAEQLGLSYKTVNTYMVRARAKMKVKTLYEAVLAFNDFVTSNKT